MLLHLTSWILAGGSLPLRAMSRPTEPVADTVSLPAARAPDHSTLINLDAGGLGGPHGGSGAREAHAHLQI
eukprot:8295524-Prorocentrum_lima.AAC.1